MDHLGTSRREIAGGQCGDGQPARPLGMAQHARHTGLERPLDSRLRPRRHADQLAATWRWLSQNSTTTSKTCHRPAHGSRAVPGAASSEFPGPSLRFVHANHFQFVELKDGNDRPGLGGRWYGLVVRSNPGVATSCRRRRAPKGPGPRCPQRSRQLRWPPHRSPQTCSRTRCVTSPTPHR